MVFSDLKYLLSYFLPIVFVASMLGILPYYATILAAFGLIPFVEAILPPNSFNLDAENDPTRSSILFFDLLLYANLAVVYGAIYLVVDLLGQPGLSITDHLFVCFSLGIILATHGINVAHEIGHRTSKFSQWVAGLLFLPSFYIHFTIEHNFGHHVHVSTPEDPATSRKGESIYAFWFRSMYGTFVNALMLEKRIMERSNRAKWTNRIVWYVFVYVLYAVAVVLVVGSLAWVVLLAGFLSILFLESINYVEHYGLVRKQLPSGKYETVQPHHSWNSDHVLGRIILYELTRHSDHHYKANKEYQILKSIETAPTLPYGYPGSILLALVPPLWHPIMQRRYTDYLAKVKI